jgi:integrase
MATMKLRYLLCDRSRHGKKRYYVRLPGKPMIRLRINGLDDPHFVQAYSLALKGEHWQPPTAPSPNAPSKVTRAIPGSFRALCERYFHYLTKDTRLSDRTKYIRRLHLENVCREPTKPGASYFMGDVPASKFGREHVLAVRDRKIAKPEAANGVHKSLNALFAWSLERGLVSSNPAAQVKKIPPSGDGFKTWGREEIAKFANRHPLGTKAHLAMSLLLYTGQRRSDVIQFGRQHLKSEELHFVQQKNRNRSPRKMVIPIAPALRAVIDSSPTGDMNFLETEFKKPFTAAGFGNWFRERCDQAGLKGYSAHGLRKAFQTFGAEAGLTDRELMALAGHEDSRETSRYTRNRDRASLARRGMAVMSEAQFGNIIVAPLLKAEKSATNIDNNISKNNG